MEVIRFVSIDEIGVGKLNTVALVNQASTASKADVQFTRAIEGKLDGGSSSLS